jgi:hypothetical protein
MKAIFIGLLLASMAMADPVPPGLVLIKYHSLSSNLNSQALFDVLGELWPGTTLESYAGDDWASFDSYLGSHLSDVDIVIVEQHSQTDSSAVYDALINYYEGGYGPVFYADGYMGYEGGTVAVVMGADSISNVPEPPVSGIYEIDQGHPICWMMDHWYLDGPDNCGNTIEIFTNSLDKILGWTGNEPNYGESLVIADDSLSVISGFYPSSLEGVGPGPQWRNKRAWFNILGWMWDCETALQPATWGSIKTGEYQ